nr:DsbA family protein [Jannaschia aquimarina]
MNRRNLMMIGGGAALGAAWAFWPSGRDGLPLLPGGDGSARAQDAGSIAEMTLGDPDAPVKVVEYASFTCPHCANFHLDTFKAFREEYIDTGRVHFTYREVYFDRYGLWASMIARCADPMRYFGIVELLYDSQSEWSRQEDPAAVAESLKRIGAQAGMDRETLDACLQDGEKAQSLVAWYEQNAASDGVRSTPSFLINGEMHAGNMSLSQLGRLVDEAAS